ncbi:tryptophan 7-halogenase [Actinokineospora auranticolor]|uniref:2-polyprenyl-6-methoxyphenol hydroxylase-like FAD-dependent oxidoreductase n=1 Tax=Actinokineospora auranticolor TaxID=155976 RepID=A0A2S6GFQ5_9PSEU|nr:tryptophan 7-halogenase [Actinokineospora auranticolor]PPK64063.1 2-polyprenyl-6-methoxyphenol hydroxylase-like FAD-dependent oxidoreductase [Actinokineospora auranticolor]
MSTRLDRAVVVGGSVAGLLAARVLRAFTDDVVVVEPDDLPESPVGRGAIAHGDQFHVLLGLAQDMLSYWFPTLLDDLVADGAVRCTSERDGRMYVDGHLRLPVPGHVFLPVHRPLLEHHLRRWVLPLVTVVRDRVTDLAVSGDRVTGVRTALGETLPADLVVDATGRASRLCEWLSRVDYPVPRKQRLALDLGYATTLYHRSRDQRLDGLLSVHSLRSNSAAEPGVSCIAPLNDDYWIATVSAYGKNRPSRDPADFAERCLREPAAGFATLVRTCMPAGGVSTHRFPHSVRRDFHTVERFPAGLVPLGDAVASFNPVYGQGIPSAALHASALAAWLRSGAGVGGYFERLRVLVDAAWQTSVIADFGLPHLVARRPRGHRLRQAVSGAIDRAAMRDPLVAARFADVVNMYEHPSALLRPDVLRRALVAATVERFLGA